MSRTARWILGTSALCFAFSFWFASALTGTKPSLLERLLFCFCILIATACFSQSLRGMALRLIGGTVFLASLWYVLFELTTQPHKLYSEDGAGVLNSVLFMLVFGLPGVYVAWRGRYPKWGKGAQVFHSSQPVFSNENAEGPNSPQPSPNAGLRS